MKLLALALVLLAPAAAAQRSPLAAPHGDHVEVTSTLTPDDRRALLDGAGMGLARPAERNRHPGPLHVLELAAELDLTDAQYETASTLRAQVLDEARALGAQIVEAEDRLDALFASGQAEPGFVRGTVERIATLRGELRAVHLLAHTAMRQAMTDAQVARYDALRGHGDGGHGGAGHGRGGGH